jgi:OOP family OmpA-OmpF porin
MRGSTLVTFLGLGICLSIASTGAAQTPIPTQDKPGSADSPLLKRYQGSLIVAYDRKNYDEFVLPLSPLERVPGKADAHHIAVFEPKNSLALTGRRTRLLYLLPRERSPLEVMRNYQEEIKRRGGKVLYECKGADCGGDPSGNIFGEYGDLSLAKFLYPQERNNEPEESPGWCAMYAGIAESRYTATELAHGTGYASVMVYSTTPPEAGACDPMRGKTYAAVDILEAKPREQKMVAVKAAEMSEAIDSGGRVALYGIYFDLNKAEVQPASKETLDQIATLLKDKPKLKLVVVGHTDNAGSFSSNIDLSQRRAAAVVSALVTRYGVSKERLTPLGVSSGAPVASNKTEEGRAKNRRVELVEK